jgi:hypothetical protein
MTELEALRLAGQTSICAYASLIKADYKANRLHRLIATHLEKAVRDGHGRLIFEIGPQHGKSRMISQDFPAWYMGKFPDAPVIAASYGADLSERNGQEVRDRIGSNIHRQIFGDKSTLRSDTTAKTHFMLTGGGRYIGPTVRGGTVGFGARLVIIDDPYKNREEAQSEVVKKEMRDWYRSVVYTRTEERTIIAVMHQRWEEDDLAGWLQTELKTENWTVIKLPAICDDEDDMLGREIGEALLPETRSREWLLNTAKILGPQAWASLYQQKPLKKGARSIFQEEWYRRHDGITPDMAQFMHKYIVVDPARTKNKGSDYTAMAVIGLNTDGNRYVLEMLRDKLDMLQRYKELTRLQMKWEPHQVFYKKTSAEADIESIRLFQGQNNYRYDITPLVEPPNVHGKNGRIERLLPDMEKGRWYFPKSQWRKLWDGDNRDMMEDIVQEEGLNFPNAKNDDFHDCISGAYDIVEQWPQGSNKTRVARPQTRYTSNEVYG